MQKLQGMTWMSAVVACLTMAVVVEAAEVRARCDYRSGRRERSKISVDAKNLTVSGVYITSVTSSVGQATDTASVTLPNDEAEFDFDSNAADIAQGAISIAPSFARSGSVSVHVTAPEGTTLAHFPAIPCPGEVRIP